MPSGSEDTTGRWRWFALSLRLLAILLCLMAALRPKVTLNEKKKQAASLVYLIDTSKSMMIADEVNGQSRWDVAQGDSQAGAGTGEDAGARPEREDSLLRLDAIRPQGGR